MSGERRRRPAATARPHASAVGTRTAPARPSRPPYLASGLLLVATLLGGVRATSLMAHAGDDPGSLRIAGATWHVTDVEQVVGVAQRDLMSGMGHNISGYVPDDEMLVKVSVVINAGDHPAAFSADWLRAYEAGSRTPLSPAGGSLGSGDLRAHATVEGSVTFVVARDGGHLVLQGKGSSQTLDLTTIDQAPPGSGAGGHHH